MANSSKYTEDWLPIQGIMNGMIQINGGYYVTGIKILPKNIFILDPDAQNNIIFNLRNFYNSIDFEFWLIVADRPVDINVYLSQLQIQYNREQNPAVRKLLIQDINKANLFMSPTANVVDTEYYMLFREKKQDLIQKRIHTMISGLANCQINSSQVSNEDLRTILDNFFNGGVSTQFRTVMPK